jgi:predicted small integral membrane protein
LVFFAFHAIRLVLDWSIPFLLFALMGCLFVTLFLALVWVWARRRPGLEPHRQRVADLQLGAGLCFFSAAWQVCGLAGAPGFALYPEVVQKLANQSFVAGQALAVHVFFVLGFVFLLLAMRAEQSRNPTVDEQVGKHNLA